MRGALLAGAAAGGPDLRTGGEVAGLRGRLGALQGGGERRAAGREDEQRFLAAVAAIAGQPVDAAVALQVGAADRYAGGEGGGAIAVLDGEAIVRPCAEIEIGQRIDLVAQGLDHTG